jgi:hypothetical protein
MLNGFDHEISKDSGDLSEAAGFCTEPVAFEEVILSVLAKIVLRALRGSCLLGINEFDDTVWQVRPG